MGCVCVSESRSLALASVLDPKLTRHGQAASHLAVVVPVRHGVLPFSDLLLYCLEFLLQEVPHVSQVAAIDPVVVDRDGVVLEGRGQAP